MDFSAFLDVVRALEREQVEYVLAGGAAVDLDGVVRATEDADRDAWIARRALALRAARLEDGVDRR